MEDVEDAVGDFWIRQKTKSPELSRFTFLLLYCLVQSTPCERLPFFHTKTRNRLKPKTLRERIQIKQDLAAARNYSEEQENNRHTSINGDQWTKGEAGQLDDLVRGKARVD
jgi:hypothetical protein